MQTYHGTSHELKFQIGHLSQNLLNSTFRGASRGMGKGFFSVRSANSSPEKGAESPASPTVAAVAKLSPAPSTEPAAAPSEAPEAPPSRASRTSFALPDSVPEKKKKPMAPPPSSKKAPRPVSEPGTLPLRPRFPRTPPSPDCLESLPSAVVGVAAVATTRVGALKSLRANHFEMECIKSAGFTCGEMLAAGYSIKILRDKGQYQLWELKEGGASAYTLHRAGYKPEELTAAGFMDWEIRALTEGTTSIGAELKALRFVAKLKARATARQALKNAGGVT